MFRYGFQQTFFIFSRFAVDIGMDVNFTIRPFWVAEANFRSCDVTGGIPIIAQPTSEEFEVQPEYLKPGTNYFIGRLQLSICRIHCRRCQDFRKKKGLYKYRGLSNSSETIPNQERQQTTRLVFRGRYRISEVIKRGLFGLIRAKFFPSL